MSSSPADDPATTSPEPTIEPSKTLEPENPDERSTDPSVNETESLEAEEEGECGFCLFMKGGDCKETFVNWEKCVEEGEKNGEDIVNKCFEATSALKKCMEAHPDYYGVILQAEKDAEQEVNNRLDQEKEKDKEKEIVAEIVEEIVEESVADDLNSSQKQGGE